MADAGTSPANRRSTCRRVSRLRSPSTSRISGYARYALRVCSGRGRDRRPRGRCRPSEPKDRRGPTAVAMEGERSDRGRAPADLGHRPTPAGPWGGRRTRPVRARCRFQPGALALERRFRPALSRRSIHRVTCRATSGPGDVNRGMSPARLTNRQRASGNLRVDFLTRDAR